jgi:predicted phage terminase large subunit-like protein
VDDIEDINSVKTREGRDKAFNWLTGELIPAGNTKTRIIAVGNLLHEDSILKRLQEKIENNEMTHMKGVYREYPIIDAEGNPLWPGKYPTKESIDAEREKTMNEIAWYREYLLQIISSEEQVVRPEWINRYIYLPKKNISQIAIGVDLAISQKASADCTAIVTAYVYGHGKDMEIYIQANPINRRIPFPDQLATIQSSISAAKLIHPRVITYIENVGYQDAMVQMLQSRSHNVIGVTPITDKRSRLNLTTSLLREGRILFPETGCEELIEQLLGFGKEKHDDLVDAFTIMILELIGQRPQGSVGLTGGRKLGSSKPKPYKPWWV